MEERFKNLEQLENSEKVEERKTSKRKKIGKRFLIGLGFVIILLFLRFLSMSFMYSYYVLGANGKIAILFFSLFLSLSIEVLIVYIILLRKTRGSGGYDKLKHKLKVRLTILFPLLLLSGFAYLTTAGVIPNFFNLEALEGHHCGPKKKYNWEDDDCYQKCKDGCSYEGCAVMGRSCSEACDMMCEVPKYENCISKCKKPKIEGYDKENYNLWHKQQAAKEKIGFGTLDVRDYDMMSYYGNYDIVLMYKDGYDKWINENFSGHVDELKKYESCLSTCGSAPGYIPYHKPIIYLYPTTETQVNVKLGTPENLLHTYPKYNIEKGRNVIAQPNGDLEDIETGRKLYALYWEGKSNIETNFDEGFVVAGKDIIPFLEEKLAILGLNEREAEEFIVYWLPQMENNEWNLIRFETIKEQDENMPLNITPKPDTVVRVMMDWKAINESIDISEQQLTTPERNGFTVVEWGGSPRN